MCRLLKGAFAIAGLFVSLGQSQELLDEVNFRAGELGGLHLVGISAFGGYSTSAYPQAGINLSAAPGLGNLGGDESYGATASLGWQWNREKANVSVLYSGTYAGMVRYSNLNSYNQSLSISAVRTLTPKWTVSLTASGTDNSLAQYLFQPSAVSVLTQIPSTFDDLAAAVSIGQFSNAQVASMLTGAPVLQLPGRSTLAGDRILSYAAQVSLGYALSSRLQLHFGTFAAAGQNRLGGQQESTLPANYIMPRSIGVNGGIGFTYSLSPRTEVGAEVEGNRTVNRYQSAYITSAMGSFGRKMGVHWFLRAQGGGSYSDFTQQSIGTPKARQIVGGGSLGFQTHSQTLVASYNRTASDSFGFAVGTVTAASGAWNWRRAGSRWGLSASFSQQQTRNAGFASLSGWQASGGITDTLNPHTTLSAQYVYLNDAGDYAGVFNTFSVQSIRLSVGWAPQPVQR
ncbi:MAG: hypothetical protein WBY44_33970 [Bryobacteraceae bacterium]